MIIGIDAKTLGKTKTGIAFYVQGVLKYIREHDSVNTYILYSNREIIVDFEIPKNFIIKKYKAKIASVFIATKLHKLLIKDKVDVFWGPEHILPKKKKQYKLVVTIHDLAFKKIKHICTYNNIIIQGLFTKKSCKNADTVICISESTKKDVIDLYNIKQDKIIVIYNAQSNYDFNSIIFSDNEKNRMLDKYKLHSSYYIFIGAIEPRKNIYNMIKAYEKYRDKTNNNVSFAIVGGLGWKYEKVLLAIEQSKYKKDIVLTGYVDKNEKECLLKYSKALMFVSLYEGLGLPIIEALSLGIPVITSNISAMPEVGGAVCNYVNNVNNPDEICNVMINSDSISYDKNILITQAASFSFDECCKKTLSVLLSSKKGVNSNEQN